MLWSIKDNVILIHSFRIMYNAIDSTGEGTGIKRNNNVFYSVYFLSYMVVVTFILLNLFVGFVIVTFQKVGVKPFKEANLDRNQVTE